MFELHRIIIYVLSPGQLLYKELGKFYHESDIEGREKVHRADLIDRGKSKLREVRTLPTQTHTSQICFGAVASLHVKP